MAFYNEASTILARCANLPLIDPLSCAGCIVDRHASISHEWNAPVAERRVGQGHELLWDCTLKERYVMRMKNMVELYHL
jgi:hypothetical protein